MEATSTYVSLFVPFQAVPAMLFLRLTPAVPNGSFPEQGKLLGTAEAGLGARGSGLRGHGARSSLDILIRSHGHGKESKMTEPSEEIKERCLFLKDFIMQSIRKHQSVVGIIFGESEETVRYVHVICITMKPKVALIKNRMRKTYTDMGKSTSRWWARHEKCLFFTAQQTC